MGVDNSVMLSFLFVDCNFADFAFWCCSTICSHTHAYISPNSITPTLQQSPQTQIIKVCRLGRQKSADFHDLCPADRNKVCSGLCHWLTAMLYHRLNSIRATQMALSRNCHRFCHDHLDMSRRFESQNFPISWFVTVCVREVGGMEFGFYTECWNIGRLHFLN